MVKLYDFSLSIAYIARGRHPYIESLLSDYVIHLPNVADSSYPVQISKLQAYHTILCFIWLIPCMPRNVYSSRGQHVMIQTLPFFPRGAYSWMLNGQVTFSTCPSLFRRFTVVVDVRDTFVDNMYTKFLSRHVTTKLPLYRYLDSTHWSNSYMVGVDRADQLCGYYRVWMKSHKFYRFVLLNLLGFILSISYFFLHNR